jgi:hypothetical protein
MSTALFMGKSFGIGLSFISLMGWAINPIPAIFITIGTMGFWAILFILYWEYYAEQIRLKEQSIEQR